MRAPSKSLYFLIKNDIDFAASTLNTTAHCLPNHGLSHSEVTVCRQTDLLKTSAKEANKHMVVCASPCLCAVRIIFC